MAAAHDAVEGLAERGLFDVVAPERRAASVGTGVGGRGTSRRLAVVIGAGGFSRCSPFTVPMMMPNSLAGWLSLRHELRGPAHTSAAACASATVAIGEALAMIRSGRADLVLAGGAEAVLFQEVWLSFARMEALSRQTDLDPAEASRPFDAGRDGFVLGEGAAMLVLVADEVAEAAGLDVLGWDPGYGASSDAHHMVAPPDDGEGAVRAMRGALDDAGLEADAITHVNAHGTSTPRNDASESVALTSVFGADCPPVTSSRGVTGHLLGATGAVEAVAALAAAAFGAVPPVANTTEVDPEITVDVVTGEPRSIASGPAMSNSFAFGGPNASVIVTPAPDAAAILARRYGLTAP